MHSGLTISQADPRPMYLQIKEQIRHRIAVGDWKAGREVPSIRALAIDLRVSVITIKRAYAELESDGVIVTHHGKGSFVADGGDLSTNLQQQELEDHLVAAARLAKLLGIDEEGLAARLRKAERKAEKK
jgi:DNA-binding transcriptional regulator YhcF (GntR family)